MSQKYFKPLKKYVSRNLAIEKLRLKSKQFDRMCVLCGIYPVLANHRNCIDDVKGWYYRIDDVRKIYFSDAYDVLCKNRSIEKRHEECLKFNRTEKLSNIKYDEYGLVNLVKNKYDSLASSLDDLGDTLRNLYFIKLMEIEDVDEALQTFEEFILSHKLLDKTFMSKKGVFYSFNCENIKIVWRIPYPGMEIKDFVEEKKDFEINKKGNSMIFIDFGIELDDSESTEELADPNNPEKFDISLLKYSAPLLATHLKLVVHKLCLLYKDHKKDEEGMFKNRKVHVAVKSIKSQIEFVLKHEDALLVSEEEAQIIITEIVNSIHENVVYLQPQFVFDSFNKGYLLDFSCYSIGKILPNHESPFPDIIQSLDERTLKTLSNTRKYKILDKVIKLD